MLNLMLAILLLALGAPALSAPYWIAQYLKIEQSPIAESGASLSPDAIFPQEQLSAHDSSDPVSVVFEFNTTAILENLAVRQNGHLLLTATSAPHIYYLNPSASNPQAKLIQEFPNASSVTGIDEVREDFFVVAVGNFSTSNFLGVTGSFSVWSVDFNENSSQGKKTKIADIPEAEALNGLTSLESAADLVLISDSRLGAIFRVNITSGAYDMVQQHALYSIFPNPNATLGINGIKAYGEALYWVNTAQQIYGRTPIDKTGNATAEPSVIAHAPPDAFAFDDLVLNWAGSAYIATHADAVTQVALDGRQRTLKGASLKSVIQQPTSLAWGRGSLAANKTLYIVGAGDLETTDPDKRWGRWLRLIPALWTRCPCESELFDEAMRSKHEVAIIIGEGEGCSGQRVRGMELLNAIEEKGLRKMTYIRDRSIQTAAHKLSQINTGQILFISFHSISSPLFSLPFL